MRIDPHRLGRSAGAEVSSASSADAVRRFAPVVNGTAGDSFERLLRARRDRPSRAQLSALERATLPLIDDPGLLGEHRSLDILQHLLDAVLPALDADPETLAMLERMLLEECDQQQALLELLAQEQAS
ncbi:hypothetical protein JQR85_14245 [Stutzerimonas urumqiensis]|uniref:hypothetical protein n=1 Tax=Stutzerimonas urumqiensis TaxID=638269 RepID=UPI003DA28182